MKLVIRLSALLFLGTLAVSPAAAQRFGFGGGESERGLRPGVHVPYDGAPFSHRYHYETGSMLYLGMDSRRIWYLDYLDRLERAEKFGYRIPADPFHRYQPPCDCGRNPPTVIIIR